jgi:polyhydroxyalkanoate synthesis regulator phasin
MPSVSSKGLKRAKKTADEPPPLAKELAQQKWKIHKQREEIAKLKRSISTLRNKLKVD